MWCVKEEAWCGRSLMMVYLNDHFNRDTVPDDCWLRFQGNQTAYFLDVKYEKLVNYDGEMSKLSMKQLIECGALYNDPTLLVPIYQLYHMEMTALCNLLPKLCERSLVVLIGIMQLRKTYDINFVKIKRLSCHF